MATSATMEKIASVHSRVHNDSRVSLSDFARGKEWRAKLASDDFMELQEHGQRLAWVISEDGMREMVDYISELELHLELASIRELAHARAGHENWKTGDELKGAALHYFQEHEHELLGATGND